MGNVNTNTPNVYLPLSNVINLSTITRDPDEDTLAGN